MTNKFMEVHGGAGFNPLPKSERKHGSTDDLCSCDYCCSEDGKSQDNPDGVWDTLATDLETGATWLVHFPALHVRSKNGSVS